ncbi:prepilin-type N-terminal cleavage/methylation domain-containing protein [Patescibacteria group bacterium]|nr:prepilin-type N-terminal cleavage/methylation domain-containing protein [Patescibacteria group bacterium]
MSFFRTSRPGFSLLEGLIVLAMIGLLAAFAAVSLNSARARTRDAQRLANMSTMRSALQLYWLEKATYPATNEGVNLGQAANKTEVLTSNGFAARAEAQGNIYMPLVPTGPKVGEFYVYKGGPNGYSIRFKTESDTEFGKANIYYMHSNGIDRDETLK